FKFQVVLLLLQLCLSLIQSLVSCLFFLNLIHLFCIFSFYSASVSDASELHWRDNVDQAFHENGLTLQGNSLLVPKTGLYFVYSQASFTGDCKDGETEYLFLSIQRKAISYLENRPLLSSMKTVCGDAKDSKDVWFKSIYQGAVFRLEKGDLLETHISDVSKLDTASGKTFFGAFHI
uniref:Lymphotoxin-alpha n=1 Tax=Erpetoichthys calabaricus TaxID=27687 RepID=A0A8C4RDS2_ERPCA